MAMKSNAKKPKKKSPVEWVSKNVGKDIIQYIIIPFTELVCEDSFLGNPDIGGKPEICGVFIITLRDQKILYMCMNDDDQGNGFGSRSYQAQ